MSCGCNNACGCNIVAGAGIQVLRTGDTFTVSYIGGVVAESYAASATIPTGINTAVFDGAPDSELVLPAAVVGAEVSVWNIDTVDDVTVNAAAFQTIHGSGSSFVVPALFTADFICVTDGEWLVNLH